MEKEAGTILANTVPSDGVTTQASAVYSTDTGGSHLYRPTARTVRSDERARQEGRIITAMS